MSKPWVQRVVEAVCESGLEAHARHLLNVMAVKADQRTASGFTGQRALAAATGFSERHVRELLSDLEERSEGPRVRRERRTGADGARITDLWILVVPGVTNNQPAQPAGTAMPASRPTRRDGSSDPPASRAARPPGTPRTSNRHTAPPLPARPAAIQGSDQGSFQGNVHPRPDRSEPTGAAERWTEFQESDSGTEERTCPSDLLKHPQTVNALTRWSRKLPIPADVLNAAGREFVDYYTRRDGRGETRKDWVGALVTYWRDLHSKNQLGAVASQQEHREVEPVTLADVLHFADLAHAAMDAATPPRPSVKAPAEPSAPPTAAGAAE